MVTTLVLSRIENGAPRLKLCGENSSFATLSSSSFSKQSSETCFSRKTGLGVVLVSVRDSGRHLKRILDLCENSVKFEFQCRIFVRSFKREHFTNIGLKSYCLRDKMTIFVSLCSCLHLNLSRVREDFVWVWWLQQRNVLTPKALADLLLTSSESWHSRIPSIGLEHKQISLWHWLLYKCTMCQSPVLPSHSSTPLIPRKLLHGKPKQFETFVFTSSCTHNTLVVLQKRYTDTRSHQNEHCHFVP